MSNTTLCTVLLSVITTLAPLPTAGQTPTSMVPVDDVRGNFLEFEISPIQGVDSAFGAVAALNQPGGRLVLYSGADLTFAFDVRIGPGACAVALRIQPFGDPANRRYEAWVVDRVSGCVSVVDLGLETIVRTIRTSPQPHGIAFSNDGKRVLVTGSATAKVDVIDAEIGSPSEYAVVNTVTIPAKHPRGIAVVGDYAYVAPLTSGNGTAPKNDPMFASTAAVVARVPEDDPDIEPLPDRDLLRVALSGALGTEGLDTLTTPNGSGPWTHRGLGTLLMNVRRRPGASELWVPNTEHVNIFRGAGHLAVTPVVLNRISIATPDSTTSPVILELDQMAPSGAPRCAQPTDVAFDTTRNRAYVCGYGSDVIYVIDLTTPTPTWLGFWTVTPRTPNLNAGPRNLRYDAFLDRLFVINKIDNSLTSIRPGELTLGAATSMPTSLGYDPTPMSVRRGRSHFVDTGHSSNGVVSCNSCHPDGTSDMLAWDLGAFLDAPSSIPSTPLFPIDNKGPMVTQSLRGVRSTGPWHWRGDIPTLESFNSTFTEVLHRGLPLHSTEMADVVAYMDSLVHPANPHQSPDRQYHGDAALGADLYLERNIFGGATCQTCHQLPLGTNGEFVNEANIGFTQSLVTPPLKGLYDKLSPTRRIGGAFATRTELGYGLLHNGTMSFDGVDVLPAEPAPGDDGFLRFFFENSLGSVPGSFDQLQAFMRELDTGLAPSTAYQVSLEPQTVWSTETTAELDYLMSEADAGHCDFVLVGRVELPGNAFQTALLYVGNDHFETGFDDIDPVHVTILRNLVAGGAARLTAMGLPYGSGRRFALDRDLDGLVDHEEDRCGTSRENPDHDGDGRPDGYEVVHGSDPHDALSFPDEQILPTVSDVRVVFVTTNTAKVEFRTSEPTDIVVTATWSNGTETRVVRPTHDGRDTFHSVVVSNLPGATSVSLQVDATDPGGNTANFPLTTITTGGLTGLISGLGLPIRLDGITVVPDGSDRVDITTRITDTGATGIAGKNVYVTVYHESAMGSLQIVATDIVVTTGVDGYAFFDDVDIPGVQPGDLIHVVVPRIGNPEGFPRMHGHIRALDRPFPAHEVLTF